METYAGLWMDHRKAVVVLLTEEEATTTVVESKVESHFRGKGSSRTISLAGSQEGTGENKMDERHQHQIKEYHESIIKLISSAKSVLIFGPGESKTELKKEIEARKDLPFKIAAVEPADKMTESEIMTKVKEFFHSKIESAQHYKTGAMR